jgi:hypothetical protein
MANKVTPHLKTDQLSDRMFATYDHASRLYVDNYYELAPKAGWMYYVELNINPRVKLSIPGLDASWVERHRKVGILAKAADMPGFDMKTEALNQYNRKSYIQTSIDYKPITIRFHDDMANVTTNLWKNYYNYYYADGTYGETALENPLAFGDNKLQADVFAYGLNTPHNDKFFTSIDIYLLNRQKYSSVTLVNPIIKNWSHGKLDQENGKDFLDSSMVVEYESVFYDLYNRSSKDIGFNDPRFYNPTPSPLIINSQRTTPITSGESLYGEQSVIANTQSAQDKIDEKSNQRAKKSKISEMGRPLLNSAYSVLQGVLYKAATSRVNAAIDSAQGRVQNAIGGEIGKVFGGAIANTGARFFKDAFNDSVKSVINAIPKPLDPPKE